jgi:hypothetical protein
LANRCLNQITLRHDQMAPTNLLWKITDAEKCQYIEVLMNMAHSNENRPFGENGRKMRKHYNFNNWTIARVSRLYGNIRKAKLLAAAMEGELKKVEESVAEVPALRTVFNQFRPARKKWMKMITMLWSVLFLFHRSKPQHAPHAHTNNVN